MKGMHAAHAALSVVEKAGAVAFADQLAEQGQITAQIEHVAVRCQHHVRRQHTGSIQALSQVGLVASDVVDQACRETGPPGIDGQVGMHMDPVNVTLRFFDDA